MIELLRACVTYQLPRPLLDFTQAILFELLPNSPPVAALEVFGIVAADSAFIEATGALILRPLREASSYILLRSGPQVFGSMDAGMVAQTLERVFKIVEHAIFSPVLQQVEMADASVALDEPNLHANIATSQTSSQRMIYAG